MSYKPSSVLANIPPIIQRRFGSNILVGAVCGDGTDAQTHKRTCRIIEVGCLKGTQFSLITSLNLKMMNNDLMIKGHEPYWARGVRGMTSLFSDRLKRPLGAFPSKCCQVTVDLTKTADLHSSNGASMMSDIELNNKIPAKVSFGHV